MTTLLQINSSLNGAASASTQLAEAYVARWQARHPDGRVVVRDLAAAPVPHLDAARFAAFVTPAEQRSAEQAALVAESDALIAELEAAEELVFALPMYNFGVPSTLKAWIDQIARAGRTFRYTADGPVGLMTGKRARVFATRGGRYAGTPLDSQTGFITTFLGFIGIRDVEFVYAEGLALGEAPKREALEGAHARIAELAA